jgi:hypothetical protein
VSLQQGLFAHNVVLKPSLFAIQGGYVCRPLHLGLKPEDFLESDQIIQLGYPPNRIDILTTLKEINFEDCYKARVEVDIQGLKINFIDLENLKHNKRATGRPQDFADAENLE